MSKRQTTKKAAAAAPPDTSSSSSSESDDYEVQLEISDKEDAAPQPPAGAPPKAGRKPYTQSERAKLSRMENLAKARAARAEQMRAQKEIEARIANSQVQEDEDEYTETESDEDGGMSPVAPYKARRGRGKPEPPTYKKKGLKDKRLEERMRKMEAMMHFVAKKNKPKRRVIHKTIVVPQGTVAPQPQNQNQAREQAKKEVLGMF